MHFNLRCPSHKDAVDGAERVLLAMILLHALNDSRHSWRRKAWCFNKLRFSEIFLLQRIKWHNHCFTWLSKSQHELFWQNGVKYSN